MEPAVLMFGWGAPFQRQFALKGYHVIQDETSTHVGLSRMSPASSTRRRSNGICGGRHRISVRNLEAISSQKRTTPPS